jgi:pimeloyl-ACP methyl ester carboxylesterase
MIPFIDFGGSSPLLHFSHANGYPPQAYAPLLENLAQHYHTIAMTTRAQWPGSNPDDIKDWTPFVHDLIQFLDEQGAKNIIGVGHSLGAISTLAAALDRPELFSAVVLIDPVIFRQRMLWGLNAFRALGLVRRVHPLIPSALKRRRIFASADEMYSRYRRAPVFSRMDDRALHAYVDSIAQPRPDGQVELSISPEWEVKIYETGPLNLWSRISKLKHPLLVIRGGESDTFYPQTVQKLKKYLPNAIVHDVPKTGHLVPMEKPDEVAKLITDFVSQKLPTLRQESRL